MASVTWTTSLQMDGKFPAPQSVLKSINCKFKKSGCKDTCSCLKGGLACTNYCQCVHNPVLIGHLMKWLAVKMAMTQTVMIMMYTEFQIILKEKVCNR